MTKDELEHAMDLYQDMVYRIALNLTKNNADAQDISQETFLRLYRCQPSFSAEEQQRAWLIRVAINLGKNTIRSRWHTIMQQTPTDLTDLAAPETNMEQYAWITEIMQKLPKADRIVLHLYYYEEYDTKSISQFLQIKEAAVRKRLSRARKRLEKLLKEEAFRYETYPLDQTVSQ